MSTGRTIEIPQALLDEQTACMARVKSHPSRPESYYIETYGCQMNAHDSENLAGMMEKMGLTAAPDKQDADLVLFNTCCVRENAERKALGNVTWLKELRKRRPAMIIGVCGCMMQQPGMAEKILKQYKFVDLAFGTHNLYRFPELLLKALDAPRTVLEITEREYDIAENLPVSRLNDWHAYVTIMYGCNNYCSYCIVPYVRGRERSRSAAAVLDEVKKLRDDGVQEIMLLGQNVNSYGQDGNAGCTFPELLARLDEVGIPRIRFMTSHPKDLSQELIDVMAASHHICHSFHLPVQSGSNEILAAMNRRYTREQYLDKVAALRKAIPDIGLTTDLIVGFPGETETQFEDTLSLVRQVRYDSAFTFIYSKRIGTKAAAMPDQVDEATSSRRIQELIRVQEEISSGIYQGMIGQKAEILVEKLSKRDASMVSGKTDRFLAVNIPGSEQDIGKLIPVKITSAGVNTLRGERL